MRVGVVAAIIEFIAEVAVQIAPVKKIHRAQSCKSIIMNGDHP